MFLSLATTHRPATDLGYVLMKHPDRVHQLDLSFGKAVVFFPEASEERCEAALVLDIDPVGLVRGRGSADGLLDQYVNDRPYAASSFLSVALNAAFRTAMTGVSRDRPELAEAPIPLTIVVSPVPVRGAGDLLTMLFAPLGWTVNAEPVGGATATSPYVRLTLNGTHRVADALSHLYVLIPVLDRDKHYWVGDDEVDKLLAKGGAWLAGHPARELIAQRYLKGRRNLIRIALARLAPEYIETTDGERVDTEAELEAPIRLHDLRLDTVAQALLAAGATSVADLGCGEGKLLARLVREKQFTRIVGLDVSMRALERATDRLKLDRARGPGDDRVQLLQGALTYRDERWHGVDAAALVEVIEHLEPDRLPALGEVVFGAARPRIVVVTTPNADYNALFPTLSAGKLRHPDHRFEWTRAQFRAWTAAIASQFGYAVDISGMGNADPTFGPVTQMAVFTR